MSSSMPLSESACASCAWCGVAVLSAFGAIPPLSACLAGYMGRHRIGLAVRGIAYYYTVGMYLILYCTQVDTQVDMI